MKTSASLARQLVVAAAVVAVASLFSPASWASGGRGGSGGGWHGGGGGWHGGSGHVHGGHWGHYGYWPYWGAVGVGIGIGYWGGYYGGYYGPYYGGYYGPYYGGYYDAPVQVYSSPEGNAPRSGQPVPQASAAAEPIFYPRNGQSAEVTESDRRECNRWATTQRGAMSEASIFQRATLACMEGPATPSSNGPPGADRRRAAIPV